MYLVGCRRNFSGSEQCLDLLAREVADAYGFGESHPLTLLHGPPHGGQVNGHEFILCYYGRMALGFGRNWKVNEIKVKVLQLKVPRIAKKFQSLI